MFEPFDTLSVVDIQMKDTDSNGRVDQIFAAIEGDDGDGTIKFFDNRLDSFGLFQFETDSLVGGASIGWELSSTIAVRLISTGVIEIRNRRDIHSLSAALF